MTLARSALALIVTSCSAVQAVGPAPTPSGERANRLSIYVGQRRLDEDDYDPVDAQPTLGLEYVRESPGSALGWEVGGFASRSTKEQAGVDVEGTSSELYAGAHKSFGSRAVHPYLGVGFAVIGTRIDIEGAGSDDGGSLANYAHGGIRVDVDPAFYVGVDLRVLWGSDIEYDAGSADGDYVQLALLAGFAF